jgi:hypothetical protein
MGLFFVGEFYFIFGKIIFFKKIIFLGKTTGARGPN